MSCDNDNSNKVTKISTITAKSYDFEALAGDSFQVEITIEADEPDTIDLTDYTWKMQIRDQGSKLIVELNDTSGITVTSDTLTFNKIIPKAGFFFYDIQATKISDSSVTTFYRGKFNSLPDITT